MAITGINNSSYTSYYASNYKNTVKKTDSESLVAGSVSISVPDRSSFDIKA